MTRYAPLETVERMGFILRLRWPNSGKDGSTMGSKMYGSIGSVSSGTLRSEDLIEEFLWEANRLRLTREERKQVTQIRRETESQSSDIDSMEYAEEAVDTLSQILDAHALPYFYFGTHPGDGANFGWWLGDIDGFDGLRVNDTADVPKGYKGEVLHVNDHGNMTLYVANRRGLREVWAIV